MKQLLGTANTKTLKGLKQGYQTSILHLAPSNLSGHNVCPKASPGCINVCLNTAGRGIFETIQDARIAKTQYFFDNRAGFMSDLHRNIEAAQRKAARLGLVPVIRLNGTSDIAWERIAYSHAGIHYANVMAAFPMVQFYDYTKCLGRRLPANYSLTFSKSETNELDCREALRQGLNVAVVFDHSKPMPAAYLNRPVVTGEESDLRFLDRPNSIVGLIAKGRAKKDASGFVVRTW